MTGQDTVTLKLGEVEYVFRFTLPRLRELTEKTGKGVRELMFQATTFNFIALDWLLWAGLANPENPELKAMKPEKVLTLYQLDDAQNIIKAIDAAYTVQFAKPKPSTGNGDGNPQEPTEPTG